MQLETTERPRVYSPTSLSHSAFPGASAKWVEDMLKKEVHSELSLRWNTKGYFEVWHVPIFHRPRCFYIHTEKGAFLPASTHLVAEVLSRAIWTSYGGNQADRMKAQCLDTMDARDRDKDWDEVTWKLEKKYNK